MVLLFAVNYKIKGRDMMQHPMTNYSRLELKLLFLCAPLIKKAKASCLITLSEAETADLSSILAGSGISVLPLAFTQGRRAFLLYRTSLLKHLLTKPGSIALLREYGYQRFDVSSVLSRFSKRYQKFAIGTSVFPHESGLLLGYPVSDIRGFIQYHGKYSLFGGYWQVYHNPQAAKQRFRYFDKLKYIAVTEYKNGIPFRDICR